MADKDPMYPGMDDEDMPDEKPSKKEDDHQTALLPLKFFEGQELKPGEEYYVTVERVFENEVEVSYPHKEEEEKEKPDKEDEAGDELEAMATDNPGNPGPMGGY